MRIGAALAIPWLSDFAGCRDAIVEFDRAGLHHISTPTHSLSAAPGRYPETPEFMYSSVFRDPFVLFASIASKTSQIRLRTGVQILPILPAAFVAKQVADLSILTDGRFDFGVGIGDGEAEFLAFGQTPRDRGSRLEEQLEVLRLLWTQPIVSYEGQFHAIDGLGLGDGGLPGSPVPIWFGCSAQERPLRRAARLGDGWLPYPPATGDDIARLRVYEEEAGRAPGSVVVDGRVVTGDDVVEQAEHQRTIGATELTIAAASQSASTTPEVGLRDGVEAILGAADELRRAGVLDAGSA